MNVRSALLEAIHSGDRAGAGHNLDAWAGEHGYANVLAEVVQPVLMQVGEEWRDPASCTLAQAYVAGKIAEDVLLKIAAHTARTPASASSKGPVAIGNIEQDFHALGRRMVGTFLKMDGWNVHDLGTDVPAAQFVDVALEVGARVIGVSAMMLSTAHNIKGVREEIDRGGLTGRVQLAVGGAVFLARPGLAQAVGGDGTAANALGAAALLGEPWARALQQDPQ